MAVSVQGLLNKTGAHLWLRWSSKDDKWQSHLSARYGLQFSHAPFSAVELVGMALGTARGYVVYDPDVPDTLNVATTLAGLDNLLIIHPRHESTAREAGLECREDFRGRFRHASRAEIYRWAFDACFHRCHKTYMVATDVPQNAMISLAPWLSRSSRIRVRVESIREGVEHDCFDYTAALGCDLQWIAVRRGGETLHEISVAAEPHRNACENSHGTPRQIAPEDSFPTHEFTFDLDGQGDADMIVAVRGLHRIQLAAGDTEGFVEVASRTAPILYGGRISHYEDLIARDLTVSLGAFCFTLDSSRPDSAEYRLLDEMLDRAGHGKVVLGWTSNWGNELSFLQQVSLKGCCVACSHQNPNLSFMRHVRPDKLRVPPMPPAPEIDPQKVYLSFLIGDGDALWVQYQFQNGFFDHKARGKMPMSWGLQPLLYDLAPCVMAYYIEQATPLDGFHATAGGIGYSHPELMPPDALKGFLAATKENFDRTGFQLVHLLEEPRAAGCPGVHAGCIDEYHRVLGDQIVGVIEGYWAFKKMPEPVYKDHFTWAYTLFPNVEVWGGPELDKMTEMIRQYMADHPQRPLFIPIHPWNDIGVGADQMLELVARLGQGVEVIRPDHMMVMMNRWHNHPAK